MAGMSDVGLGLVVFVVLMGQARFEIRRANYKKYYLEHKYIDSIGIE